MVPEAYRSWSLSDAPWDSRSIQVYAARFGGYTGPIDGALGPNSWAGFALGLERP